MDVASANEFFDNVSILINQGGSTGGVLLGDVNCDGIVDLLDIGPFIALLVAEEFSAKADINEDGVVDLLDIGPFVALINAAG